MTVPGSYPVRQHRLRKGSMENSSAEKDLGIVLGRLGTSQQCVSVMETNCMVGCSGTNVDSRLREVGVVVCLFVFSSSVAIC